MVPIPQDFGTLPATFGNHIPNPNTAFRGGDLWIRYADGSLKNLTQAAGYGNTGFQGAGAIAVRDPSVSWDGTKVIFSMVVGAPTARYQITSHKWQLYEVTGLGSADTPVITKVSNQPTSYNNISPTYASDDSIIFVSDRPRDDSVLNTYPQRDEYESSPVNSGLWKLNPQTGEVVIIDHAPSGDFNPIVDSYGRVIFTRWDHLQRDQQNVGASMGAFNYVSESSSTTTSSSAEIYPEPRDVDDPDYKPTVNLMTINQFFPWAVNQDGTDLETLNHVGRQEIGMYIERSFNDDPNVQEFYGQYATGANQNEFNIFLHIKEDPTHPGTYLGTNCQEFGTHAAGQILSIQGPPGMNPDAMTVTYLTHPDTAGATNSPSVNHTGLYRDPVPLSNGKIIAAHTSETRQDTNEGTTNNPVSRYSFRLKLITKPAAYYTPSTLLTSGISKSISFWNPDEMVSYSGNLWEMMAVELKARARPNASTLSIPAPEAGVIASLGVSVEELKNYLKAKNLALVISRNLTVRDKNDRQQPTNLRVSGTSTQSLPHSGKIYDISHLEFFQGDLIRGYNSGNSSGRRVLAQRMHSVEEGINPILSGAAPGSVQIAEDGSMAAFVPARRALTWQTASPDGSAVVRERYWVTFQPGEIRVCASCHGVNSSDHLGNPAPSNPPLALAQLLAHWKELPAPEPTATPTPNGSQFSLRVSGLPKIKNGGKFLLSSSGPSSGRRAIKISVNGALCASSRPFNSNSTIQELKGKFPSIPNAKIKFMLFVDSAKRSSASVRLPKQKGHLSQQSFKDNCNRLLKSLRP